MSVWPRALGLFAALLLSALPNRVGLAQQSGSGIRAQNAAAALVRGDGGKAVTEYTAALDDPSLPNDRRAGILTDRAVAYARLNQPKLALDDYNRALQLFPENAAAYNNRGSLLIAIGLASEAIKDFDRAILLVPGYAPAYGNRATAAFQLGNLGEALADYTRAIALAPSNASAISGRGYVLLTSGRPHAAIRDFSRAIGIDARFASAYRHRARANLDLGTFDAAIEDLSRAIAFDPSNHELFTARGDAYLAAANPQAALKDFASALQLRDGSPVANRGLAIAHVWLDQMDEALAAINKAISADGKSGVAFATRAYIYSETSQTDLARADIAAALRLGAPDADVMWAKGEVADANGLADEAVANLRRALELRPGHYLARAALDRLGVDPDGGPEQPIEAAGLDKWRVVKRGATYFALNDDFRNIRVPLEMAGSGEPKILSWQVREDPHKGYGTLRFFAGQIKGARVNESVEHTALLDLYTNAVVGIVPDKQGERSANWTWENGRLMVAGIDGLTDEFTIRPDRARPLVAQRKPSRQRSRTLFELMFGY